MRRHRLIAALGLTACLVLPSCSTSAGKDAGGLVGVTSSPIATGAPTTAPSGVTSTPTSTTTQSNNNNGGGGGGGGGSKPLTVGVTVDPVDDVTTSDCPHTFTLHGTITVNKGPTTLQYAWQTTPTPPTTFTPLKFNGTGQQALSVTSTDQLIGSSVTGTATLVISGHTPTAPTNTTSFKLTCGATVETPVTSTTVKLCPYPVTFQTNIHVVGPQYVTYEWVFSDGTTKDGNVNFTGPNPDQTTIFAFGTATGNGIVRSYSAYVKITSAGGFVSKKGFAGCLALRK